MRIDLPLNFHPAAIRASAGFAVRPRPSRHAQGGRRSAAPERFSRRGQERQLRSSPRYVLQMGERPMKGAAMSLPAKQPMIEAADLRTLAVRFADKDEAASRAITQSLFSLRHLGTGGRIVAPADVQDNTCCVVGSPTASMKKSRVIAASKGKRKKAASFAPGRGHANG